MQSQLVTSLGNLFLFSPILPAQLDISSELKLVHRTVGLLFIRQTRQPGLIYLLVMGVLFSFKQKDQSPSEHRSSIDALSDEEIYDLIDVAQQDKANNVSGPTYGCVWRITHDAVAKSAPFTPAEPFVMSYVSSHTSIRMPRVRRVLPFRPHEDRLAHIYLTSGKWIIMDFVEGDTLKEAWPSMSWWARLRVMWYIRTYIRQLHSVPVPFPDTPGPFDDSGKVYKSNAYFFMMTSAKPFNSYSDMADWFDERRFYALFMIHNRFGTVYTTKDWPKFDRSYPLTLCHMDLHMSNIIVGRDGIPWIIDWGYAGAYPAWLEYAVLSAWEMAPKFWLRGAGFMTGNHGKYVRTYFDRMRFVFEELAKEAPPDYFTSLGIDID